MAPQQSRRDIFVLTIRPEPPGKDDYGRDPLYRLKGVLKTMRRRFGWRCVSLRPQSLDEYEKTPNPEPATAGK